jgi:hypothetical protein
MGLTTLWIEDEALEHWQTCGQGEQARTWCEIAPEMAQTASGGQCRQWHDCAVSCSNRHHQYVCVGELAIYYPGLR